MTSSVLHSADTARFRLGRMPDSALDALGLSTATRDAFCARRVEPVAIDGMPLCTDPDGLKIFYDPRLERVCHQTTSDKLAGHEIGHMLDWMENSQAILSSSLRYEFTCRSHYPAMAYAAYGATRLTYNAFTNKTQSRRGFLANCAGLLAGSWLGANYVSRHAEKKADTIMDGLFPEIALGDALDDYDMAMGKTRRPNRWPEFLQTYPITENRIAASLRNCKRFQANTALWI